MGTLEQIYKSQGRIGGGIGNAMLELRSNRVRSLKEIRMEPIDITLYILLNENLRYEDDGKLYWTTAGRGREIGDRAGRGKQGGYRMIGLFGKVVPEHTAVFTMHNVYRPRMTDHINRIKDDNRIENLRDADYSLNAHNRDTWGKNSKYGRNVCWHPRMQKYRVQIQINKKQVLLGEFRELEEAQRIAKKAREMYNNGEYELILQRKVF